MTSLAETRIAVRHLSSALAPASCLPRPACRERRARRGGRARGRARRPDSRARARATQALPPGTAKSSICSGVARSRPGEGRRTCRCTSCGHARGPGGREVRLGGFSLACVAGRAGLGAWLCEPCSPCRALPRPRSTPGFAFRNGAPPVGRCGRCGRTLATGRPGRQRCPIPLVRGGGGRDAGAFRAMLTGAGPPGRRRCGAAGCSGYGCGTSTTSFAQTGLGG